MKLLLALPFTAAAVLAGADTTLVDLKVTHRALVPLCIDSTPAKGTRQWKVEARPVTMTFTTRNEPRSGVANTGAGVAAISFVPEPGHRYEVEVRADGTAYSLRVYEKGEWTPVVRDRTTDRIVSGPAEWRNIECNSTADSGSTRSRR